MEHHNRRPTPFAALIGLLPLFLGCHSSPTEPEAFWVRVRAYPGATITNVTGEATLIRLQTYFDGVVSSDSGDYTPRSVADVVLVKYGVTFGAHTLRIQVTNQTSSPNTYRLSDFTLELYRMNGYSDGPIVSTAFLTGRTDSLTTGGAFTYDFSFTEGRLLLKPVAKGLRSAARATLAA